MRSVERRKLNVLEMKFLRSLVGVSRMDHLERSGMPLHDAVGINCEQGAINY